MPTLEVHVLLAAGGGPPAIVTSIAIAFVAAAVLALICERLRLPSIAGFIFAGLLVGPVGLGFIDDAEQIETIAGLGLVLLLFLIGLELDRRAEDRGESVRMAMGRQTQLHSGLAVERDVAREDPERVVSQPGVVGAVSGLPGRLPHPQQRRRVERVEASRRRGRIAERAVLRLAAEALKRVEGRPPEFLEEADRQRQPAGEGLDGHGETVAPVLARHLGEAGQDGDLERVVVKRSRGTP